MSTSERPTLNELWTQAGGGTEGYDAGRYLNLMREHGHVLRDDEPHKKYEWHEECDGPICQGCDSCMCEGGCQCDSGPRYSPEVAEDLATCNRVWWS